MVTLIRILFTLILLLVTATAGAAPLEGVWVAETEDGDSLWLSLSHRQRGSWMSGFDIELSGLEGLSREALLARAAAPVVFELRRDAGAIAFRGHFRDGEGSGHFTFEADEEFTRWLEREGFERPSVEELFVMTAHEADRAFVSGLRELGLADLDTGKLLAFAIHRVTPAYVRELRGSGFDLDTDEFLAWRIHGVTPEWVAGMRSLDLGPMDASDLLAMKIHGITPEFVREIRALGIEADGDDIIAMKIHGVTPEFVREIRALGIEPRPKQFLEMKIHGVTPRWVREMRAEGVETRDASLLIRARIHGIDRILARN